MKSPRVFAPILFAVACTALMACGSKKSSAPQVAVETPTPDLAKITPAELMPVAVGNEWTYTMETSIGSAAGIDTQERTLVQRISEVKDVPGGKRAVIEVYLEDRLADRMVWDVTEKGIFQISSGVEASAFTPPQTILMFPLNEHAQFDYKGKGPFAAGAIGDFEVKNTVLGFEEIETAAGMMNALPVRSDINFKQGGHAITGKVTCWFSPKVGLVRLKQFIDLGSERTESVLMLKSHTLKGGN